MIIILYIMFSTLTIKEVQREIGQYCKTLRKTEGLTQAELAEKMAMSRLTISNLERGENFTIETMLKVFYYFGELKSLYDFIQEKNYQPKSLY